MKLKRGTATRDQDEVIAKTKGKTLADTREDMETLREYIYDLAADCRTIQPEQETSREKSTNTLRSLNQG